MDLELLKATIFPDFRRVPKRFLGMFYGDNGSGKTKLALEIADAITPPDKKILYIDTSAGYEILSNHPDLANSLDGRLMILPFNGEGQLKTLADAIHYDQAGFGAIGTVIPDESSSMAQQFLDVVVEYRTDKDETKEKDKADWPDYNIAGNKWRKVVQSFQQIPGVNFIEVCHFRTDKIRGKEKISPAFQPSVGNDTRKEKRVIGYCYLARNKREEIVRAVQITEDETVTCKNRLDNTLPPIVSHETLVEAIRNHQAKIEVEENATV